MRFEPDVVQLTISGQGYERSVVSYLSKSSLRERKGISEKHMIGAKRFSADFPKGLVEVLIALRHSCILRICTESS